MNCLLSLGKLLEKMDKWFVLDEILPLLPQIPSREPAVLMSILGKYFINLLLREFHQESTFNTGLVKHHIYLIFLFVCILCLVQHQFSSS